MNYANDKITTYLKDVSERIPAPGGGSTAAMSAAMAASLISMVCRFTIGRAGYEKHQRRIKEILSYSLKSQKRLIRLIDEDARAYRTRNLDLAIKVPAEIATLSFRLLESVQELVKKGNKHLSSDMLMAAMLCEVSFIAGFTFVKINLNSLNKDRIKYNKLKINLGLLSKKVRRMRKKTEVEIG